MRILVAEDDPGLCEVLVLGLEDGGYQVDAVERGDDAIDQLKFYEYDVAILDWRMPGAEGIDVVRWALALDPVTRRVTVGDRPVSLTPTELNILELLLRRAPAVVDRKAIAEHAWRDETDPLGSNAIDVQMSRLRAKLPGAGIRIVTVRGAGYRLEES